MTNDPFDYSGLLVFSPFEVRSKQGEETNQATVEQIIDNLPRFSRGTPNEPGEGYEDIWLESQLEATDLPDDIISTFTSWRSIRYRWEEYSKTVAYVDGSTKEVMIPSRDSVDVFLHPSRLAFIRGKKSSIRRVTTRLQRAAGGNILLNRIKLNLTPLINELHSKFSENPPHVSFEQAQRADFKNTSPSVDEISFTGNLQSDSLIKEASRSGELTRIEGKFNMSGISMVARVGSESIFVKAERDLADMSDTDRIIASLVFCTQIINRQTEFHSTA